MPEILASFHLTPMQWALAMIAGMSVGLGKTGLSGAGTLAVPILAVIVGGRPSAGLLLPMLCVGDLIGVSFFNRHADWDHLLRLLPPAAAGILFGTWVGTVISDKLFTLIMGVTILGGIAVIIWRERMGDAVKIPNSPWFGRFIGFLGGFSSMIGNSAGPPVALYFLSMRIPKMAYVGSWAWFFFLANAAKVPLHVFIWKSITLSSLAFDAVMIPAIGLGALIGVTVVKKLPEQTFRWIVIAMTAFAAIKLFF